ncbi:helix-turn-helix domain-containing protein [Streptomyces sp. NPDC058459]|uniref:helix-turn-helix domain-containing protein n=1 Tax=Streptomyces sp. NPDC058459 TaxID=3346508 RepID=UPI0036493E0B
MSGFVLRLVRESIPCTQAALAEALGVDVETLQGWESGRRPLANMRAGALLELRRRLPALGADVALVPWLDAAMDADRIIAAGLEDETGAAHPLAGWVHTRDTAHMLAWALNGTVPPALAGRLPRPRRGPVAAAPQLAAADRAVFFDHLRDTTEAAARQGESGVLLHRQALYLASYGQGPDAAAWTAHTLHRRRDVLARRGWSPHWAEARSTATALARLGDPQPLLDFIDHARGDALPAHLRTCHCRTQGCPWHPRHRGCAGPVRLALTRDRGGRVWRLADACGACAAATGDTAVVPKSCSQPSRRPLPRPRRTRPDARRTPARHASARALGGVGRARRGPLAAGP